MKPQRHFAKGTITVSITLAATTLIITGFHVKQ